MLNNALVIGCAVLWRLKSVIRCQHIRQEPKYGYSEWLFRLFSFVINEGSSFNTD